MPRYKLAPEALPKDLFPAEGEPVHFEPGDEKNVEFTITDGDFTEVTSPTVRQVLTVPPVITDEEKGGS